MPPVTWLLQTNLTPEKDLSRYRQAIDASGARLIEVHAEPFSDRVPDISIGGPCVLHGTVGFVTRLAAAKRWLPGLFADPKVFTYQNSLAHYGEMLFNSGAEITTIAKFADSARDVFVRPTHDDKSFVGEVRDAREFRIWCQDACRGDYAGISPATEILVAEPHGIEAEWRLFIADGEVVGATQYRQSGRSHLVEGAPRRIRAFAAACIDVWSPAPVYVLDVCLSGGTPWIMEAQSFNASGCYEADLLSVAICANHVATRMFKDSLQ